MNPDEPRDESEIDDYYSVDPIPDYVINRNQKLRKLFNEYKDYGIFTDEVMRDTDRGLESAIEKYLEYDMFESEEDGGDEDSLTDVIRLSFFTGTLSTFDIEFISVPDDYIKFMNEDVIPYLKGKALIDSMECERLDTDDYLLKVTIVNQVHNINLEDQGEYVDMVSLFEGLNRIFSGLGLNERFHWNMNDPGGALVFIDEMSRSRLEEEKSWTFHDWNTHY